MDLQDQGVIDSGCSRHMTWNMSYLTNYEEIDEGYVAFRGNPKGGKNTGKCTIKTGNLDFENVYFVRELKFNLFSVSQMCDKKNSVLFNDTECIVLSPNFKLIDESQVLLRVPRKNNMYSVDLKNIVPKGGLTCLFSKATSDESKLWHRRLGHLNFKTMNKLVKGNLVRGLPSKLFENDQTCVACQKGKQHRASCKSKTENSISLPLHLLHMDLFGLTFIKSLMKKMYCLAVIDDYYRFTWVFFLATKDETSGILKSFITGIENLVDHKVKVIRCDNGTEFKNREMNQFCEIKGILRQYSVARTPQQNRVAKRRNRTLIEAARTMLADSKLPTTFWAEAFNTACYVQNKVLVVKPHNKTPFELFHCRTPTLSFMRPFGCPVTIINTIDHLGKFDGKADEGFFIRYSLNSKAFRVFNSRTRIVEENLHIRFSENIPNVVCSGLDWLFDIDALTKTMNYKPIVTGTQSNGFADDGFKPSSNDGKKVYEDLRKDSKCNDLEKEDNVNSTNTINAAATLVSTASTIPVSAATITDVEITLAQALAKLKSARPKATTITTTPTLTTTTAATTITAISTRTITKGLIIHEHKQAPTPIFSSQQPSQVKVHDKGKGKMVKPEPVKKMSKKELLRLDEELAFKLQAKEEEEEERLAREKSQKVEEPKADKVVIQEPKQGTTTTMPTLTTTTAATTIIADSTRPKTKGIVFHEQEQAPTSTVSSQQLSQVKF
ncbi:putative ribonuclease H-like domain-containing protein [Tanacetum coccineum]